MRTARILLLAALVLSACSSPQPDLTVPTLATLRETAVAQAPTRTPSPQPTLPPTRTPTATATPTPTPLPPVEPRLAAAEFDDLRVHLEQLTFVQWLPFEDVEVPPDVEVVLLPAQESLWYAQRTLYPEAASMDATVAYRLWVEYSYVRDQELAWRASPGIPGAAATKDLTVRLSMWLEDVSAGTARLVANWSATAGEGAKDLSDMVARVLDALREERPQLYPYAGEFGDVVMAAVATSTSAAWRGLSWYQKHAVLGALIEGTEDWADQRNLIHRMGDLLRERPNDDVLVASAALILCQGAWAERLEESRRDVLIEQLEQSGFDAVVRVTAHPDRFVAARAFAVAASEPERGLGAGGSYASFLASPEWQVRALAAHLLTKPAERPPDLVAALLDMAQDGDPTLRALSLAALKVADSMGPGWRDGQIYDLALNALDDPDPWVRAHAAMLLGDAGGAREPRAAAKLLSAATGDGDALVRTRALLALAQGEPTEAVVQALKDALARERGNHLLVVLEAAAQMGAAAAPAAPALGALLRQPDETLAFSAAHTLGQMGVAAIKAAPALAEVWCRTGQTYYHDILWRVTGQYYASCGEAQAALRAPTSPHVVVVFVYLPNCGLCEGIVRESLMPLRDQHVGTLTIVALDLSESGDMNRAKSLQRQFGVTVDPLPAVFVGADALIGGDEIRARLPALIEDYMTQGGVGWPQK